MRFIQESIHLATLDQVLHVTFFAVWLNDKTKLASNLYEVMCLKHHTPSWYKITNDCEKVIEYWVLTIFEWIWIVNYSAHYSFTQFITTMTAWKWFENELPFFITAQPSYQVSPNSLFVKILLISWYQLVMLSWKFDDAFICVIPQRPFFPSLLTDLTLNYINLIAFIDLFQVRDHGYLLFVVCF